MSDQDPIVRSGPATQSSVAIRCASRSRGKRASTNQRPRTNTALGWSPRRSDRTTDSPRAGRRGSREMKNWRACVSPTLPSRSTPGPRNGGHAGGTSVSGFRHGSSRRPCPVGHQLARPGPASRFALGRGAAGSSNSGTVRRPPERCCYDGDTDRGGAYVNIAADPASINHISRYKIGWSRSQTESPATPRGERRTPATHPTV